MAEAIDLPDITKQMILEQRDAPSPEHIRSVFERYGTLMTAGDTEGIVALYAPDAVVRDPVSGPPCVGHDAIRAWYQGNFDAMGGGIEMLLDGAVRIAGSHAAAPYVSRTLGNDIVYRTETLDVMTFNADGLITSMNAYWGASNFSIVSR